VIDRTAQLNCLFTQTFLVDSSDWLLQQELLLNSGEFGIWKEGGVFHSEDYLQTSRVPPFLAAKDSALQEVTWNNCWCGNYNLKSHNLKSHNIINA